MRWFSGSSASASSIFCASSPCNNVSVGRKFFLSSYCRCGWPSCSAWVSSRDSAGWRERRRSSFRHRLRAMVNSHVENFARRFITASRICRPGGKHFAPGPRPRFHRARCDKREFITGCLYFSTNSTKAARSPRLTRSIRTASGSGLTGIYGL